jgi:hypothetical protein
MRNRILSAAAVVMIRRGKNGLRLFHRQTCSAIGAIPLIFFTASFEYEIFATQQFLLHCITNSQIIRHQRELTGPMSRWN